MCITTHDLGSSCSCVCFGLGSNIVMLIHLYWLILCLCCLFWQHEDVGSFFAVLLFFACRYAARSQEIRDSPHKRAYVLVPFLCTLVHDASMDGACCGRDVVVTCCVPLHKQLLQHIWLKCFAGGGSQCKYDDEMDRKSPTVPGLIILLFG